MITTRHMSVAPHQQLLIAEASDLKLRSTDITIDVQSHRTNKVATFRHERTIPDREGHPEVFVFVPDTKKNPELVGWAMHVLND